MTATLKKSLIAFLSAGMLFWGTVVMLLRGKTVPFLQLVGAGFLVVVVLTHVFEALHLFPFMHWGDERSIGHYLDLSSAVLGVTLFATGFLLHALGKRNAGRRG